jgi:hypothetical protein
MPWGLAVSAAVSAYSADRSESAQEKASKRSTKLQKDQFERGIQEVAPFKEAALPALTELTAASIAPMEQFNFRDSGQFLNDYFNSAEFGALNKQATNQIMRNQSMTGGLRSGATNANLAQISPMLGLQALDRVNQQDLQQYSVNQGAVSDRFNRLFGLSQLGANIASGNQVAGQNFGSAAGQNAMAAGAAKANAYQQYGDIAKGLGTDYMTLQYGKSMGLI